MGYGYVRRLLFVETTNYVAIRTNVPRSTSIPCQIAVLDRSLSFLMDPDSLILVAMYSTPLDLWIASRSDLHSGKGIAHDVTVLDPPLPFLIDEHSDRLPIMDCALAQHRGGC